MMLPRVTAVEIVDNKTLQLTFDNDEVRRFIISAYLQYPVYNPLNNPIFFASAKAFNGTVVWGDAIDFAPETLYLESEPIEKGVSSTQ